MNIFKQSISTILCCALAVNTLGLSSIIANATESDSKDYVYDGYKISYDVTNSWGNTEIVSVTLSNTGDSTIENWMLYFDPNGQVHDTVNVQEAQTSDGITYFRNSGPSANNGYTPVISTDNNRELYCTVTNAAYGRPGGGEIMYYNSDALPNDIEMILIGYYCNKKQYFTPGTNNEASYAIKESNIYLNTEDKKYYIWENGAFVEYTEGDVA